MSDNYRLLIKNRLLALNALEYKPHRYYRVENNNNRYALYANDTQRLSNYLSLAELYKWIDGFMTCLYEVQRTQKVKI